MGTLYWAKIRHDGSYCYEFFGANDKEEYNAILDDLCREYQITKQDITAWPQRETSDHIIHVLPSEASIEQPKERLYAFRFFNPISLNTHYRLIAGESEDAVLTHIYDTDAYILKLGWAEIEPVFQIKNGYVVVEKKGS